MSTLTGSSSGRTRRRTSRRRSDDASSQLGAGGLTVAKTGEAEVFQEAGAQAILVHYPPFGTDKWERLADVAASGVDLTVAVDSVAPAEGLADVLRAARAAGGAARRARRRPPSHGSADRRRRARGRAGALAAPGARSGGDQLLPGALPPGGPRPPHATRWPWTSCCERPATCSRPRVFAATASRAARRRPATSPTRPA